MRNSILIFFIGLSITTFGWDGTSAYDWDKEFDPAKYEDKIEKGQEATIIFQNSFFLYDTPKSVYTLDLSRIEHRLIWVEEESAIEKLNEIYLPNRVVDFKARIIKSNGEVQHFDKSKIEEITTSEGSSSYKKLALPGVEPKVWVELFYTIPTPNRCERLVLDNSFFVREACIVIASPERWTGSFVTKVKAYNGFEKDTTDRFDGLNAAYSIRNVLPNVAEKYAHDYADEPRVDFTIIKTTWKEWSDIVYRDLNPRHYKGHKGSVKKLLKEIGADTGSEVEKISKIDRYLKENITLTEQSGESFDTDITSILKNRIASEFGLVSTFMHLFNHAGITFNLYLAPDQDYIDLVEKHPMSYGLSNFIFYFPINKNYLSPTSRYYSLGPVPKYLSGHNALRITNTETFVRSHIKTLPRTNRDFNVEKTSSIITLDEVDEVCKVHLTKSYFGDRAIWARGYFHYSDEKEKEEYFRDILLSGMETTEIEEMSMKNEDIALNVMSKDTMHTIGTLISDEIATPISGGYLLNLSKVIGAQGSFYEEGERHHKIFVRDSKVYDHTIRFKIPGGYKVESVENYVFDREFKTNEGRDLMAAFKSTAEVVGDELIIKVHEFYEEGIYPKEEIELYKGVINAAYEFYIAKIRLIKE